MEAVNGTSSHSPPPQQQQMQSKRMTFAQFSQQQQHRPLMQMPATTNATASGSMPHSPDQSAAHPLMNTSHGWHMGGQKPTAGARQAEFVLPGPTNGGFVPNSHGGRAGGGPYASKSLAEGVVKGVAGPLASLSAGMMPPHLIQQGSRPQGGGNSNGTSHLSNSAPTAIMPRNTALRAETRQHYFCGPPPQAPKRLQGPSPMQPAPPTSRVPGVRHDATSPCLVHQQKQSGSPDLSVSQGVPPLPPLSATVSINNVPTKTVSPEPSETQHHSPQEASKETKNTPSSPEASPSPKGKTVLLVTSSATIPTITATENINNTQSNTATIDSSTTATGNPNKAPALSSSDANTNSNTVNNNSIVKATQSVAATTTTTTTTTGVNTALVSHTPAPSPPGSLESSNNTGAPAGMNMGGAATRMNLPQQRLPYEQQKQQQQQHYQNHHYQQLHPPSPYPHPQQYQSVPQVPMLNRMMNVPQPQGPLAVPPREIRHAPLKDFPYKKPVARGPQPSCMEPTRLPNGRRIHPRPMPQFSKTGPGGRNMVRAIRTTVENDNSWMEGYTHSTWVDSPTEEALRRLNYREQRRKAKQVRDVRKDKTTVAEGAVKKSKFVETIRNMFS